MTNIVAFEGFSDASIRVTPDGRYSVYDVIKLCTGSKNPRQLWNGDSASRKTRQRGLTERFPEVVRITDRFKFDGRGQKETPVAGREGILQIIGLLPGAIGQAYRAEAAKVFLQFLDASPELAESVIDRAKPEDLKRIEARLRGRQIRVKFCDTLMAHGVTEGWQFAACTDATYVALFDATAKGLRQQRGLSVKATPRETMSTVELAAVYMAEALADEVITAENRQGFRPCKDACLDAGDDVRTALERSRQRRLGQG